MVGTLPAFAGFAAAVIFAASMLPMLARAARTRELSSYSFGNICLVNLGNAVYSFYVFSLPPGPIWLLHAFYVVSSACMLVWFVRFRHRAGVGAPRRSGLWGAGRAAADGRRAA